MPRSSPARLDLGSVAGLTLPAAAYVAGVESKSLRNWLDADAIALLVPQNPGAWRRCQPVDVVRIAVLGRLVAFGFTLAEANDVLGRSVDRLVASIVAVAGDVPWPLLDSQLFGLTITVSRERDGIAVSVQNPFGSRDEAHADTWLTIDVGRIVQDAGDRARGLSAG